MDINRILDKIKKKSFKNITLSELFTLWASILSNIMNDVMLFSAKVSKKKIKDLNTVIKLIKEFFYIFIKKQRAIYSGITMLIITLVINFIR